MARFDLSSYQISTLGPLPAGKYEAIVMDSAVANNKSGSGSHLKIEFKIVTPGYVGRKVWSYFNTGHGSRDVVQIAMVQLKTFAHHCGCSDSKELNTEDLHGKRVGLLVTIEGENNRIKGYYSVEAEPKIQEVDDCPF